jgi:hypothetical protein
MFPTQSVLRTTKQKRKRNEKKCEAMEPLIPYLAGRFLSKARTWVAGLTPKSPYLAGSFTLKSPYLGGSLGGLAIDLRARTWLAPRPISLQSSRKMRQLGLIGRLRQKLYASRVREQHQALASNATFFSFCTFIGAILGRKARTWVAASLLDTHFPVLGWQVWAKPVLGWQGIDSLKRRAFPYSAGRFCRTRLAESPYFGGRSPVPRWFRHPYPAGTTTVLGWLIYRTWLAFIAMEVSDCMGVMLFYSF